LLSMRVSSLAYCSTQTQQTASGAAHCCCRPCFCVYCCCITPFTFQTKLDGGKGPSVLSQARYLSSTSGGSWFNAAFSYKKVRHEPLTMPGNAV